MSHYQDGKLFLSLCSCCHEQLTTSVEGAVFQGTVKGINKDFYKYKFRLEERQSPTKFSQADDWTQKREVLLHVLYLI